MQFVIRERDENIYNARECGEEYIDRKSGTVIHYKNMTQKK
jgi:hypothetical protein